MEAVQKYFQDIKKCIREFNINLESLQFNNTNELLYSNVITEYKKLFLNLLLSTSKEEIEENTTLLVHFAIENDISYLFLYSELITVVRKLLSSLLEKKDFEYIDELNHFFAEHEHRITELYLQKFLNQLKLKSELRLSRIDLMPEKNLWCIMKIISDGYLPL